MGPESSSIAQLYLCKADRYEPICKLNDCITAFETEGDLVSVPQEFTIELTGSFEVQDNSIIFDITHPIKCNCRNCGAPVRLEYCEYCGTPYPTDRKLIWEYKK